MSTKKPRGAGNVIGGCMKRPSSLGKFIRVRRLGKKWSQADLGDSVHLTAAMISNIERGAVNLLPKHIQAFKKALGLDDAEVRRLFHLVHLQRNFVPGKMPYHEVQQKKELLDLVKRTILDMDMVTVRELTKEIQSKTGHLIIKVKRGK